MQKSHVALAALAMLVGFGTAFGVEAASYRDIGTVAEGVYLLDGDGAFKVQALEPVTAVIYDSEGALLLAKALGGGESRTFVVGDGAVVAILGGDAKVAARNDGKMMPLETTVNLVELADNSGSIDESFSVKLPPFLVGLSGKVRGEAQNLIVEVTSSKGLVYRYTAENTEVNLGNLVNEVFDARITADKLDGRIVLEVHQPDFGQMEWAMASPEAWGAHARPGKAPPPPSHEEMERHKAEAQRHHEAKAAAAHGREAWTPPVSALEQVPTLLRFDQPGVVQLAIEGGHALDLSLYDAAGAQVQYLALGATVAEVRSQCAMPLECGMRGGEYSEVEAQELEWTLEPGLYLLYVRLGAVEGAFAFTGLGEHVEVAAEETSGATEESEATEVTGAVLDVHVWAYDPGVDQSVQVLLNGVGVYEERSMAGFGGFQLGHEVIYDPSLLAPGTVEVLRGGLTAPTGGINYSILFVPSLEEATAAGHEDEN